jgi:predicted NBD/HSP70 family sugar kinase
MSDFLRIDKTLSSKYQNKINISIVFNYLREKGPISRIKISKNLGLSAPSVSKAINYLEEKGYISEIGEEKTSVGVRPKLLKINSKGYVIGVDIGKRRVKVALVNLYGNFIYKYDGFKVPSNIEVDDKKIIADLISLIKSVISEAENKQMVEPDTLKVICFAVSAPVSIETKKIVDIPLYGKYRKIDFVDVFGKEFDVPIIVENDVNCSAFGENKVINDKNITDMIFIEISRGIGSGIILNNRIFKGSHGTSGEIGNSIINISNLNFKIRNKGFLEKYASVEGMKKSAIRTINQEKESLINNLAGDNSENIEAIDIFLAAIREDKLAKTIINNAVDLLSIAILNLILIIDPQLVVIGGDICRLPESQKLFLEPIIQKIKNAFPFKLPELRFSLAGKDAGVLGAALIAVEYLILEEFPFKINF